MYTKACKLFSGIPAQQKRLLVFVNNCVLPAAICVQIRKEVSYAALNMQYMKPLVAGISLLKRDMMDYLSPRLAISSEPAARPMSFKIKPTPLSKPFISRGR